MLSSMHPTRNDRLLFLARSNDEQRCTKRRRKTRTPPPFISRSAVCVKINSLARFRSRFKARALLFSRESEREDEEKNNVTRIPNFAENNTKKLPETALLHVCFLSQPMMHRYTALCFSPPSSSSPSSSIASFLTRSKKRESMMPSSRSNEDARHKVSRSLSRCL